MLLLLIIIVIAVCNLFYTKEQFKCRHKPFQNHTQILPYRSNNTNLSKVPRKDVLHSRHSYLFLIKELQGLFPINNPIKIKKHNSKKINAKMNDINITSDYIIRTLNNKFKKNYKKNDTINHLSYNITDKYNPHYAKDYSIYDLLIKQNDRNEYILLNVHIANKDIIKVEYITSETTDKFELQPAYTGNYHHSAAFSSDQLY